MSDGIKQPIVKATQISLQNMFTKSQTYEQDSYLPVHLSDLPCSLTMQPVIRSNLLDSMKVNSRSILWSLC